MTEIMSKFVVYSHNRLDVESDMIRICSCDNKNSAKYVIDALKYRDTMGKVDHTGVYNYYIIEEK